MQTLHERHFDRGTIISQTGVPTDSAFEDVLFDPASAGELYTRYEALLADVGATALLNDLRAGRFLETSPSTPVTRYSPFHSFDWESYELPAPLVHARKIVPEDRRIRWAEWSFADLRRRYGALGPLWDEETHAACSATKEAKRVIFHHLETLTLRFHDDGGEGKTEMPRAGTPMLLRRRAASASSDGAHKMVFVNDAGKISNLGVEVGQDHQDIQTALCISTCEGSILQIKACTVDSGAKSKGQEELLRLLEKKIASTPGH